MDKTIEYRVFVGMFHKSNNGARVFDTNLFLESFDGFEGAYEFFTGINLDAACPSMSENSQAFYLFKRLERVEFFEDGTAFVDVIMFRSDCEDEY